MAQAKSTYAIFCEMLRHPSAKPLVARIKSFVERFPSGLSRYDAAERIHDFLTQSERWMFSEIIVFEANADEQGRIDASEGLEKMIICRLYARMFEIEPSDEEDDVQLSKHIDGLSWVEPKHLGIPSIEPSLWPLVVDELRRMDEYKAPCDKLTCVVNACHVINDVLKRTQAEVGASRPLSADDFLPLLIYAVMKANPVRLHSNVEFVAAFRHPSRLNGEHAYWITMLMSAKEFVKQAGPATLDVSPEDYTRLYAASLKAAESKGTIAINWLEEAKPGVTPPESKESMKKEEFTSHCDPAPVQEPEHAEILERTLLEQKEVLVYQIPPASSAAGHKSGEWQTVIWKGPCRVVGKDTNLAIRMLDKNTGSLFAECLIPADEYHNYVEPVIDSEQYFALKILNGQKHAVIGLCFADLGEASDFRCTLQSFRSKSAASQLPQYESQAPTREQPEVLPMAQEHPAASGLDNDFSGSQTRIDAAKQEDPFAFAGTSVLSTSLVPHTTQLQTTNLLPAPNELQASACPHEPTQMPMQQHVAMQQACSSQRADPFAEFVDLMSIPDVHNTLSIPVTA